MYNVLEKLRSASPRNLTRNRNRNLPPSPEAEEEGAGLRLRLREGDALTAKEREEAALTATEREIHEHGLVSVLRQLHDDLDASRGLRLRPPARRQARILADGRYVAA